MLSTYYKDRINNYLENEIAALTPNDKSLKEAMGHALLLGGKRIRPFLAYSVGKLKQTSLESLDPVAAALECIHTYSLIHDDLPAMDDDELRRGQPTVHILFDDALAILAGDALHTLAFELISRPIPNVSAEQQLRCIHVLSKAAGYQGMCGGQAMDLAATNQAIALESLINIHLCKTGALIVASIEMACIINQFSSEETEILKKFGKNLGLAFQIQDDILDVVGATNELGKPIGSDEHANKSTYPQLLGLKKAQNVAEELIHEAILGLEQLPYDCEDLKNFALFVIKRTQ